MTGRYYESPNISGSAASSKHPNLNLKAMVTSFIVPDAIPHEALSSNISRSTGQSALLLDWAINFVGPQWIQICIGEEKACSSKISIP